VISPESDGGSSETRHSQLKRKPKKPGRSPRDAKKLLLHVYGMSSARIDSAIQEIENLCKDTKKQKLLKTAPIQDFVSKITQEQVDILSIFWKTCRIALYLLLFPTFLLSFCTFCIILYPICLFVLILLSPYVL